jgi:hypothetical protein
MGDSSRASNSQAPLLRERRRARYAAMRKAAGLEVRTRTPSAAKPAAPKKATAAAAAKAPELLGPAKPTNAKPKDVTDWKAASRTAAGDRVHRTGRDVAVGESYTFGADKSVSGQGERLTVVGTRTMAGRADAVSAVKIVRHREGRPTVEQEITVGDWQRHRDRHARAYGY